MSEHRDQAAHALWPLPLLAGALPLVATALAGGLATRLGLDG